MQMAVRDGLIAFMAAMSQAQAEPTKEAQRAGIEHARNREVYGGGKPSFSHKQLEIVRDALAGEAPIATIAAAIGLSGQAVYRIKNDPVWAEGVLSAWTG
jgi:putative DNA-invertase from lambdoid prophage Rac